MGSKIVTLADSFDAMMTDRPYRSRLSLDQTLSDLRKQTGKQFDVEVVAAFCRLLLKEISGATRDRVFIPMIGLKFDRVAITATLDSMLTELDGSSPAVPVSSVVILSSLKASLRAAECECYLLVVVPPRLRLRSASVAFN